MLGLDVRSVILIAGILSLLMAVVLFFLRRNYPPTIRGLGEWAAAPVILFLATLLFGARGTIPNFFSIVIGNLFLLSGATLLYLGSQQFLGFKPSIKLWAGVILVALVPLFWFSLVAAALRCPHRNHLRPDGGNVTCPCPIGTAPCAADFLHLLHRNRLAGTCADPGLALSLRLRPVGK